MRGTWRQIALGGSLAEVTTNVGIVDHCNHSALKVQGKGSGGRVLISVFSICG